MSIRTIKDPTFNIYAKGGNVEHKNKPIKKSLGLKKTLVKSFIESPKPRENIIKANDNGKITSVTIPIFIFYHFYNKKKSNSFCT